MSTMSTVPNVPGEMVFVSPGVTITSGPPQAGNGSGNPHAAFTSGTGGVNGGGGCGVPQVAPTAALVNNVEHDVPVESLARLATICDCGAEMAPLAVSVPCA